MSDAGPPPSAPDDASSWAEKRYQRLFDTMAKGVVYQDASGAIIDANPAAERLLGMTLDQMTGVTSVDPRWRAVREDMTDFPGDAHPAMVALRTGRPVDGVVMGVYRPNDGRYAWLQISAQPEFDGEDSSVPTMVYTTFSDITERKRSETELRRRRELEELLADVATSYINLPADRLDDAIQDTMNRLGAYIGADRFYVFSYDWDANTTSNTHEWCADGIEPEIDVLQNVPVDAIPPWVRSHRAGRTMRVDDVNQLPEDDELRSILEPQGIQSLMAVPIMIGDDCHGFVGLDSVRERRDFSASEERLLRVFAQTIANVTQRKATTDALRENRRFLFDIIENSGSVVFVKDPDGRYLIVNRTWQEVTGHEPDASIGKTDAELFDPVVAAQFTRNDAHVLETGETVSVEEHLVEPDGTQRTFLSVKFPMRDNAGTITGVCGMATDVTELKRAQDAMRRSEERTRTVLDSVPAGLLAARADDGAILFANGFFERMVGLDSGSAIGRSVPDLHPPEVVDFIRERFVSYAAGAATEPTREVPVSRRDDSRFLADIAVERGELDGDAVLYGVYSDVTEAAALKRQERARTEILSAMVSGEGLLSVQQRIVELIETVLPDAIASVLLLDEEGRRVATSFAPGLPDSYNDALVGLEIGDGAGSCGTAAATHRGVYVEDVASHPYWDAFRELADANGLGACWSEPIMVASGEAAGTVAVYFRAPRAPTTDDKAQLKLAADLVSLAVEQERGASERIRRLAAESANRSKSAFLANMSHEIRTPLNAVIGFAQILEWDDALGERQREQVRSIARSGEHLLRLINDVLDLSKIEAGHVQVTSAPIQLRGLFEDVASVFAFRAEAKGLRFEVEIDDRLPAVVVGDEAKIRQILVNLVGNALKFTDEGGVAIRARADAVDREVRLVIEVEDSGPGMTQNEVGRIFDSFQQGDAGRDAGGTGLGLAISRRLAHLLGGSISVDSTPGRGSRFRVVVPVSPDVEAAPVPVAPDREEQDLVEGLRTPRRIVRVDSGDRTLRVLSVDDKEMNRVLLRDMLERVGFEVRDAADGAEAVEVFSAWKPDLVLMDMRMPVMDGYEATRRIKAAPGGAETPIVAVTASAFEDDEKEVFGAGVDGYVRKPFRWDDFFSEVARATGFRFVRDAGDGAAPAARTPAAPATPAVPPDALRPVLAQLERLLEQDDVAAQDVVDDVRTELTDALGGEGDALIAEIKGFAFPAALATVRSLLERKDP